MIINCAIDTVIPMLLYIPEKYAANPLTRIIRQRTPMVNLLCFSFIDSFDDVGADKSVCSLGCGDSSYCG